MRLINGLAATLIGATVILIQPQNIAALENGEINNIAKQITVRIEGVNKGTGVIVHKQGNIYTVLTNHHVVLKKGKYTLITPDGKTYSFNSSQTKKLPNLDLALVQFISNENYNYAKLGDANQLTESTTIYNAGWAVNDSLCLKGCYRFYSGIINGISPDPQDGYALIFSNNTLPGMSGGPILNSQGELVGINGQSFTNGISRAVDFAGIPINSFVEWRSLSLILEDTANINSVSVKLPVPPVNSMNSLNKSNLTYIWPAKGVLTNGYGWRWGRMHRGIDIANSIGTPIYAASTGLVEKAGWDKKGNGNMIDIRHPDGSLTRYSHNSRLFVQVGQEVKQGQLIAEMGSTGLSTGPHSHFEIHPPGKDAVNPISYLPPRI